MRLRTPKHLLTAVLLSFLLASLTGSLSQAEPTLPTEANANAGWEEVGRGSASLGGISDNAGSSQYPSLAIGPDGAPVVAWQDSSEIYVRRWNGSAWVEMGQGSASGSGISNNSGTTSWAPSLAIDLDGAPIVAWQEHVWEIYVRRWNGSIWAEMGPGSASDGGISDNRGDSLNPSIAIGSDGAPLVAWQDRSSGNWEIYVRRWDGSVWAELGSGSATGGGISHSSGGSYSPSLAIGPDGTPFVAWEDDSDGDREIYVRRWNGSAWVEMGRDSASGGGISDNSDSSWHLSLAIGPDSVPTVAWQDYSSGNWEIYVRRWNGNAWAEVGPGSASGGGVSNNVYGSTFPSLRIGVDGAPVVAWTDGTYDAEIYVRRWNGSVWAEVGEGSASGGGISDNLGGSARPSLAIGPDGMLGAAWVDSSSGEDEIYVRLYIPPSCHRLFRNHSGAGADPTTTPALSVDCNAGEYLSGEIIELSASAASGWQVTGWSGTRNNSSVSPNNAFTMPRNDHEVTVHYLPINARTARLPHILTVPLPTCPWATNEREPNNEPQQANLLPCRPTTISGRPDDLNDYYRLDLATSSILDIALRDLDDLAPDVQLQLWNDASEIIALEVSPPYQVRRSVQSGIYYVRVVVTEAQTTNRTYTLEVR